MNRHCSPALRLGSAALVLASTTTLLAAGCGASSPSTGFGETKMTSVPSEPAPQTVGEAEARFATAEQDVFGALGDKRDVDPRFATPPAGQLVQPTSPGATTAAESAPPPPPTDSYRPHKEDEGRAAAGAAPVQGADAAAQQSSSPCVTACRALASMDRAATHICQLAGSDDARCTNARERVRLATERVRQSCSDCGAQ